MAENGNQKKKKKTSGQRLSVLLWTLVLEVVLFVALVYLTGRFIGVGYSFLGFMVWGVITYLFVYLVLAAPVNNVCFIRVPEMHGAILLHLGVVKKAAIRWRGHELSPDWTVRPVGVIGSFNRLFRRLRQAFGGLVWVGIFPWADVKAFREEAKGKLQVIISLQDRLIPIEVREAEDSEGIQLSLKGIARFRVVNPYKAIFKPEKPWIDFISELLPTTIRDALTQGVFLRLITSRKAVGDTVLTIMDTDGSLKEWKDDFGLEMVEFRVTKINMEDKELYKKLLALWEAEKTGKGTVKEAEVEAEAFAIRARAVEAKGDVGKLLVITDALKKGELPASVIVHAFPGLGLQDLAGNVFARAKAKKG